LSAVEFTNGDQPGVGLTKAAAAQSAEPARSSKQTVPAKAVPGKTAKANREETIGFGVEPSAGTSRLED
jgi:hypothetical protein